MNIQLLIDAIVRQTTVLIAQLATSGGIRAPLAHVANQVFLDLASELDAQGVSRKVSADMFGMALRAYVRKVQRLSESSTDRGRSLWEAVYDHLCRSGVQTRRELIDRFYRDDEQQVRGVLHDLAESGLVFCTGSGPHAAFRAATEEELGRMRQFTQPAIEELIWVIVYREGPIARSMLSRMVVTRTADLDAILENLVSAGRIRRQESDEGTVYRASEFILPLGAQRGWEAALFDHYHALVRTMCQKLRGAAESSAGDAVGGSTYTYGVWPGHPLRDEVLGLLASFREKHSELRSRVDAHNERAGIPATYEEVVFYGGQSVTPQENQ